MIEIIEMAGKLHATYPPMSTLKAEASHVVGRYGMKDSSPKLDRLYWRRPNSGMCHDDGVAYKHTDP